MQHDATYLGPFVRVAFETGTSNDFAAASSNVHAFENLGFPNRRTRSHQRMAWPRNGVT